MATGIPNLLPGVPFGISNKMNPWLWNKTTRFDNVQNNLQFGDWSKRNLFKSGVAEESAKLINDTHPVNNATVPVSMKWGLLAADPVREAPNPPTPPVDLSKVTDPVKKSYIENNVYSKHNISYPDWQKMDPTRRSYITDAPDHISYNQWKSDVEGPGLSVFENINKATPINPNADGTMGQGVLDKALAAEQTAASEAGNATSFLDKFKGVSGGAMKFAEKAAPWLSAGMGVADALFANNAQRQMNKKLESEIKDLRKDIKRSFGGDTELINTSRGSMNTARMMSAMSNDPNQQNALGQMYMGDLNAMQSGLKGSAADRSGMRQTINRLESMKQPVRSDFVAGLTGGLQGLGSGIGLGGYMKVFNSGDINTILKYLGK